MNAAEILQAIYDSEINAKIEWLWDGGVDASLFDGWYGDWRFTENFKTVDEAVDWMAEKILEHYPNSGFAKNWKASNRETT